MAASIHKFQTSRGRPTVVAEQQRIEHNVPFMDKIDSILYQLAPNSAYPDTFETHIRSMDDRLDKMISIQEELHKTINHLTKQVDGLIHRNELLKGLQETVHKLVDKL
jgi:uncharacterized protein YaaN involved in tellurite resistance